jgi:hypothetical protein
MWHPYITKKINYKKIILVSTIFGGFSVFSPLLPLLLIIIGRMIKLMRRQPFYMLIFMKKYICDNMKILCNLVVNIKFVNFFVVYMTSNKLLMPSWFLFPLCWFSMHRYRLQCVCLSTWCFIYHYWFVCGWCNFGLQYYFSLIAYQNWVTKQILQWMTMVWFIIYWAFKSFIMNKSIHCFWLKIIMFKQNLNYLEWTFANLWLLLSK